jgi:3-oxoacyl-[acyl-carrier protein] reductase
MDYPDLLVNNYGINHLSWIGTTVEQDEDILRVNVLAPYWIVNWFVGLEGRPMRVINIASQTYRVAQRTTTLYCASKAALVHMTRVMARELAPKGWIINAIAPGKIEDTEMATLTDMQVNELRGWSTAHADKYALSQIPMDRFTDRNEVTDAVMHLIKMPPYVNGTVLDMTGGV